MPASRSTVDDSPRTAQSAPSPACACGRLRRATRALTQLYDDAMAPAGLRVTQFSLLRTLARDGPLRISDLAARQLLDRTALSRNLDPLVEHGYVDIVCGRDARTREVAVTRKGTSALRVAEPYWMRAQKEVARRLGVEKLDALIAVLGELESLHPSSSVRPSPQPSPRAARRGSETSRPSPQPAPRAARRRT
jgi:DNA-binding MarR family transcriptional regulator